MRFEQLPNLKQKIENVLDTLLSDTEVDKIDWTVKLDIGERKIVVDIIPQFPYVADESKFGETGEKGSDTLPEKIVYTQSEKETV